MQPKDPALRKRTQIAKANHMMFIWVAVVSVIVGFALVGSIFLAQKLFFNERVLAEKERTITVLKDNNAAVPELENRVRVLNTDQALIDSMTSSDSQAVQVVLDALPSDANSLALGASLQSRLLSGIPGLTINSIQPDPVVGVESLSDGTTLDSSTPGSATNNVITFQFSVSGNETALKQVLTNLERSIRTIDVIALKIETQQGTSVMTIQGQAFYEPVRSIQLIDKTVK